MQGFFIISTIIKARAEIGIKFLRGSATEGVNVGHGVSIVEGHLPSFIIQVYANLVEIVSQF